MALSCFRCAGYADLDHARDCPHRTTPVHEVVELSWPTVDDGRPASLERAIELVGALDDAVRRPQPLYWVCFTSTDIADERDLDGQTTELEDSEHTLPAIQRYCQLYRVGAVYGDASGARGAVTRQGTIVPDAPNPRDVAHS
jgi:hypothetical protein